MKEFKPYTIEEIQLNIKQMNKGNMHEIDQLTMMCYTQRSLIRILQEEIKDLKYSFKTKTEKDCFDPECKDCTQNKCENCPLDQ